MKKELKDLNRGEIFKEEVKNAKGSEQKGYRPLMVVSDYSFNAANEYVLVCPLSKQEYSEPDGIEVETKNSLIKGWVLTQHLTPYYPEYIVNKDSLVSVVDEVKDEVLDRCLKVLKAISTTTNYPYTGFTQGEIIEVDINGESNYAIVLSENSFNQCHNSVWVAPITIESDWDGQADHVCIKNTNLFSNEFGMVYIESVRNIDIAKRNAKKTNFSVSVNELNECMHILNTFFN